MAFFVLIEIGTLICLFIASINAMRKSLILYLFLLFLLLLIGNIQSQSVQDEHDWYFSLQAGTAQYDGDYGSEVFKFNRTQSTTYGIGIGKELNNIFSFDLGFNYAKLDYSYNEARGDQKRVPNAAYPTFSTNIATVSASLKMLDYGKKLFPIVPFKPFVESGFFVGRSNTQYNEPQFQRGILAGVGISQNLNPHISISLALRYNWFLFDQNAQDAIEGIGNEFVLDNADQDEFLATTISLRKVFNGKKKQAIAFTNFNSTDTDADGVTDNFDQCPTIIGEIETFGCPDSDRDGIANKVDLCPNVAGTKTAKGCPDQDFDGITDLFDDCPTIAGNTLYGCLDTDFDGVIDEDDNCPNSYGFAHLKGCNTLTIYFETDSFRINSANEQQLKESLNEIIKTNLHYNTLYFTFEGFTDDTGSDDYNLILSKNRANEVADYLIKFLSENNITIDYILRYFGENKALNDNETDIERAKNRRVLITIELIK